MNKARIFLVLLVALAAGGLLSYWVYQVLQTQPQVTSAPPDKQMAVAQNNLGVGDLVKNEDVGFVPCPE